jgi:hypothetical protein
MTEQTCQKAHQHYVMWDAATADAIATALNHVFTEDTDPEVTDADIETVRELVEDACTITVTPFLPVDSAELAAIERVIGLACEYMINNNYADDADFPEDALAAQLLGDGHIAWDCQAQLHAVTGGRP